MLACVVFLSDLLFIAVGIEDASSRLQQLLPMVGYFYSMKHAPR